jgi:hypothetical protein
VIIDHVEPMLFLPLVHMFPPCINWTTYTFIPLGFGFIVG